MTIAAERSAEEYPISLRDSLSREVALRRIGDLTEAHAAVLEAACKGAAVALIRNTVDEAVANQASRADAHVLERGPRPGPTLGGDRPGRFRDLLHRTRRGWRSGPEAGAGSKVRSDLFIGLGRRADLEVQPEVTRSMTVEVWRKDAR